MAYCEPEASIVQAKKAVNELVLHLQQNLYTRCGISVDEVVKAGSLGHGTAVPGNFDLDLVLYSRSIEAEEVEASGYGRWLSSLAKFLQETLRGKVQSLLQTRYIVQFTYEKISVDLLVSPFWETDRQSELYDFLRSIPQAERYNFSVNASKWQVQFFQSKPPQVKELIRRAKAWRNKMWPKETAGGGRPKSYMLSVLVLCAYEKSAVQVGTQNTGRIARQTTSVLQQMVRNHHKLDVYWEEYYKRRDYPDLLPSRPRIIDPANPTNNLYKTGITSYYEANDRSHDYGPGDGDWTLFTRYIDSLDLTKTVDEV